MSNIHGCSAPASCGRESKREGENVDLSNAPSLSLSLSLSPMSISFAVIIYIKKNELNRNKIINKNPVSIGGARDQKSNANESIIIIKQIDRELSLSLYSERRRPCSLRSSTTAAAP